MTFKTRTEESRDDWGTPDWIYNWLDDIYAFNIDLAANASNKKTAEYLGPGSPLLENALAVKDWNEVSKYFTIRGFLNPPFKSTFPDGKKATMADWLERCYNSTRTDGIIVALVPANVETEWWHEWVLQKAYSYRILRGRVNFDGSRGGSTFPSAVVVYVREPETDRPGRRRRALGSEPELGRGPG